MKSTLANFLLTMILFNGMAMMYAQDGFSKAQDLLRTREALFEGSVEIKRDLPKRRGRDKK